MSGPVNANPGAVLRPVKAACRAACGGGLRPALTALARGAFLELGRDGETPFSRTKKLRDGDSTPDWRQRWETKF
jgi:hypothetical protein